MENVIWGEVPAQRKRKEERFSTPVMTMSAIDKPGAGRKFSFNNAAQSALEIVGEDISGVNFSFHGQENTFASRGQKLIYWGPLKPLENLLLRTFLVPWSYVASITYHDLYWYPFIGRRRVKEMMNTGWGKLFQRY